MTRDRLSYLLIPVAALIAVLPLILQGPSCGHDFDFHILSWLEAAAQFRHGNLHPQWAFSPAWNAGEPRFVFYPPISWTLGAILGLILPWTWTPVVYTWLALTASGLAMHRLARAHAGPTAALLASAFYLANPYTLFTAYERTAYAELLAAAWLPLLVHAILKPRPSIPAIAIPLALLWLTNAPAAVMSTYALALLSAVRIAMQLGEKNELRPYSLALTTVAGTLLGLALAGSYILPAAVERPLVEIAMVVIPGMRVDDNTLFHHTGITEDALAHDAVLHTASLIAVLLLVLTAAALLVCFQRAVRKNLPYTPDRTLLPPTILALTTAVLLTPVALPIWHRAPELSFLQFPWRLLAILAVVLGLAAAVALRPLNGKSFTRSFAALAVTAALTAAASPTFRQPCDVEDTVSARLAAFQSRSGVEPTDEYTPVPSDNDALQHHDPPFWLSTNPDAPPPTGRVPGSAPLDLTVESAVPQYLILNLRRYPAWHVTLDGKELPASIVGENPRADGLFDMPVPAGTARVRLVYRSGSLEHIAEGISILAGLTLLLILVFGGQKEHG